MFRWWSVACLTTILIAGSTVSPASASASTLLKTVASSECADTSAQTWRIGYRLYFADDAGRTTDRAAIPGLESEAQQFADSVAVDSACALRAVIDIYDMGGEQWQAALAKPDSLTPPSDNEEFRSSGDYDATFMRYPANGTESYAGITSFTWAGSGTSQAAYPWSAFPVDSAGRSYSSDPPHDPWRMLLMHEWMHEVVFFYIPAELGWPTNDVHGGYEHGYVEAPYVNERYFSDMLQGKVPENGQLKGLLPQDYAVEGTPAHPRREYLFITSRVTKLRDLRLIAPKDFDGTLTFTVQAGWGEPNLNRTLIKAAASGPSAKWTLDDSKIAVRHITVCISSSPTGSARYRPYHACDQWTVPRCAVPRLIGLTLAKARRKLARANCRLGSVHHRHGRGRIRIRTQSIPAGRHRKPASRVNVTVGPPGRRR